MRPLLAGTILKSSNGWRVTVFDSAESHKTWMAQNYGARFKKKMFPLMIPGGMTGDLQGPDRGKSQPFKAEGRADQEEHDFAQAGTSVLASSRLDMLIRVKKANRKADAEIDAPLVFKQSGTTLALDGTEDHLLATDLQDAWRQSGMAEWRAHYIDTQPRKLEARELFAELETVKAMCMEVLEAGTMMKVQRRSRRTSWRAVKMTWKLMVMAPMRRMFRWRTVRGR